MSASDASAPLRASTSISSKKTTLLAVCTGFSDREKSKNPRRNKLKIHPRSKNFGWLSVSKNSPSKNSRWRNLKITGEVDGFALVSFWAVPLCRPFVRFCTAKMEQTNDKKNGFFYCSVSLFIVSWKKNQTTKAREKATILHVPKYGQNWHIYKVSKKNQKKVKKNLVVSFFCRTFVTEKERNNKQTH